MNGEDAERWLKIDLAAIQHQILRDWAKEVRPWLHRPARPLPAKMVAEARESFDAFDGPDAASDGADGLAFSGLLPDPEAYGEDLAALERRLGFVRELLLKLDELRDLTSHVWPGTLRLQIRGSIAELCAIASRVALFDTAGRGAAARRRKRNAGATEGARRRGERTRSLVREQVAKIFRECRFEPTDARVRGTLIGRLAKDHPFAKLDRKQQLKHIAAIRAEFFAERIAEG
jgi:hypothetical protein